MAIEKDPSIYRDRGAIGSSEELDEYGVWVKSDPDHLSQEIPAEESLIESDLPDIEDLPDLSLDDDSLPDFEGLDLPIEDDGPAEEPTSEIDSLDSEAFSELSVDDFLEDSTETEAPYLEESDSLDEAPLDMDLAFEEPLSDEEAIQAESIDIDDIMGLDTEDEAPGPSDELEAEVVSDFDDFINELSDAEVSSETEEEKAPENHEEPGDSASIVDTVVASPSPEDEDLSMIENETLPSFGEDQGFDDIQAVSDSLLEETPQAVIEEEDEQPPLSQSASSTPKMDLSTELLLRIANELSSIKDELSSLKDELSSLKGVEAPPPEKKEEEPVSHGFFDEEEDEKIALTGDELDNILNTADFTEEAGSDAVEADEQSDFLSDQEDILGDNGAIPTDEEGDLVEEPSNDLDGLSGMMSEDLLSDTDQSTPLEEPVAEEDEFSTLQKNGVQVMTEAPEDTSYLDEEVASEESFDLSDAVIDEPDLGGLTLEDTILEEPDLESINIDLDLEREEGLATEEVAATEEEPVIELSLHDDEFVVEPEESSDFAEDINISDIAEETFPEVVEEEVEAASEEPADLKPEDEPLLSLDDVLSDGEPEVEELPDSEESFAEVLPEDFVVEAEGSFESPIEADIPLEEELPEVVEGEIDEVLPVTPASQNGQSAMPDILKNEVKSVLAYMDQLLESLPEEKIEEFARSEYFDTYKKLFEELGLA